MANNLVPIVQSIVMVRVIFLRRSVFFLPSLLTAVEREEEFPFELTFVVSLCK